MIDVPRMTEEVRTALEQCDSERHVCAHHETLTFDGTEYVLHVLEMVHAHGQMLAILRPMKPAWLSDTELRDRYGLTRRQIEVARLLAERRSDKEIAKELRIRENTVGSHVQMVKIRLGIGRRIDVRDLLLKTPSARSTA